MSRSATSNPPKRASLVDPTRESPGQERLAPVALFAYDRLPHLQRTVEALKRNDLASRTEVVFYSDGPREASAAGAVAAVRSYLRTVSGFRSVTFVERDSNLGLAGSIIAGVSELCARWGEVIVLEDDLVTGRGFLRYMNDALRLYENDHEVASIHGYCYPVAAGVLPPTFFLRGADCWGWATWSRAWRHFEPDGRKLLQRLLERNLARAFDLDGAYGFTQMLRDQIAGRNDSWAIRWHASCFLRDMLTLYPGRTLVTNIGNDGSGTHRTASDAFTSAHSEEPLPVERIALAESALGRRMFARALRRVGGSPVRRWLRAALRQVRTRDVAH